VRHLSLCLRPLLLEEIRRRSCICCCQHLFGWLRRSCWSLRTLHCSIRIRSYWAVCWLEVTTGRHIARWHGIGGRVMTELRPDVLRIGIRSDWFMGRPRIHSKHRSLLTSGIFVLVFCKTENSDLNRVRYTLCSQSRKDGSLIPPVQSKIILNHHDGLSAITVSHQTPQRGGIFCSSFPTTHMQELRIISSK